MAAFGKIKKFKNYNVTEISCAARENAAECRYRCTWDPDITLVEHLKDFFHFRFSSHNDIIAHMNEAFNRLREQYDEVKKLNEQLSITLHEKTVLSEQLHDLNLNLERKVAEQTTDIRAKNDELTAANKQLRESERMKDLLTGALVHDIKNHIFSIASDVRALKEIEGCALDARTILYHTSSACSLAMSLASNMLDIGKMEEGRLIVEKRPVDFNRIQTILSRYMQNFFFRERNITTILEPPDFCIAFDADYYLLDRVLQNLLTNAVMYTPYGGIVRITFQEPMLIKVFNSGEPIPEKYRETLFEKYSRVNMDSSRYSKGLGLFFCRLVMQAHGGEILLECTGEGNGFILKFREQAP